MHSASTQPLISPSSTILVVDDHALVRMMLSEHLRDCGFGVIEAESADEAILILGTNQRIDLVISDVVMPGTTDGFGLARWIAQERTGLNIILTSGYHGADRVSSEAHGRARFIAKPYALPEVVSLIREMLSCRTAG